MKITNKKINALLYVICMMIVLLLMFILWKYVSKVLIYIYSLILPLIISMVLCYVLNPFVALIQKFVKKRSLSIILLFIIIFTLLFIIVKKSIPIIIKEFTIITSELPVVIGNLECKVNSFFENINISQISFDSIVEFITDEIIKLDSIPKKIIGTLSDYIDILAFVPILTVYFLIDYEKIKLLIKEYLDKKKLISVKTMIKQIDKVLQSFIKGYIKIIVILFISTAIIFKILNLKYALLFALVISVTDIIPFIGPIIGGCVPIFYTLAVEPNKTVAVITSIIIIQIIESNILTPFIQSKQVKIHPILVLVGLIIFGEIFGLIGYIFAVPIISILKVIFDNINYLKNNKPLLN